MRWVNAKLGPNGAKFGSRTGRRQAKLLAVVALAAAVVATLFWQGDLMKRLDLATVDTRFDVRGAQTPPPDLLVVDIDAASIAKYGRWPFDRRHHARVINRLNADGVRAIAYDVQFTEPSEPRDDELLIDAVARADGKVVLSSTEVDENGGTNVFGGGDILKEIGARAGNSIMPADPGGVIRRFPFAVQGLTSLPVATAEVASGHRIKASDLGGKSPYIDYPGPPQTIRHVSFRDVAEGKVSPDLIRGKTVVVGATAPSLKDVFATSSSGDQVMAGAEIIAAAIGTIDSGVPLRPVPGWVNLLLIVLLAVTVPVAALRYSSRVTFPLAIALGVAFGLGAQAAFSAGWIVTVVYPLLALGLSTVGTLAVQVMIAAVERERVRDMFARFVPDEVVEQVLKQADGDFRLAVRMESSVLFSDLRGFTTFAEQNSPDATLGVLNHYLTEMSDAIFAHGGTLVAYMGDGIMAVFGAPIGHHDHADRALAAAREMAGPRLANFNAYMQEQGLGEGFRMGVGVNSGEVMSGNVGSSRRMEYTAIGDTTNTAARLEGMTKGTDHQVFISGSTHALLSGDPEGMVDLGDHEIRGRREKLRIWAVDPLPIAQAGPP